MNTRVDNSDKKLSIGAKIDLVLVLLFLIILLISSLYQFQSQRSLVEMMVKDQATTLANAYFDNVNTLMLTGGMANKSIARTKLTSREDVLDARIVRAKGITAVFGKGTEDNQAKDDWDMQALTGKSIATIFDGLDGRTLTVALPMLALKESRGTNCLLCHIVPEGDVLGVVRVDLSLKKLDARVLKELWINLALNSALLIMGLIIISFLLKKMVVVPLTQVTNTIDRIEQESNLNIRVPVRSGDELGKVALAINRMMEKFSAIIDQVSVSTSELVDRSQRLADITEQNIEGVRNQQSESDQAATAMTEMEQTAVNVAANTSEASDATRQADQQSEEGRKVVNNAINSINTLADNITQASMVIKQLEENSDGIGKVIEVISQIAEQTNLLALNAAIEAARAGEQGRGFAVVADEVRTLATRTHKATQEIQGMIEGLQGQAKNAAKVMSTSLEHSKGSVTEAAHAGESLDRITQVIGTINQMNKQIATAANEQSVVAGQISCNIVAINDVTSQAADNSEKVAQESEKLSKLAENLQQLMGQFTT